MNQPKLRALIAALTSLAAFLLWTAAVCLIDVQAIGPAGSAVGFAALNGFIHRLTGVHWTLYGMTDRLGLVPAAVAGGFALAGLVQWIRRKSLLKVDRSILVLGGLYASVAAAYLLFERFPVNYRPVLIEGILEASYPSSTTLLVLTVMPTAMMQAASRIKSPPWKRGLSLAVTAFTAFMVIGRLVSGVHWLTDIIGGILLSTGLVLLYRAFAE